MATATILHIGEDVCRRIPVIQTAGFAVFQSEISIPAIRTAFDHGDTFSAVVFHSDISSPPELTVHEARNLSQAPFILFQNPAVICDETDFNLVIPPLTPPAIWLQKLVEVIQASRKLCEQSAQLRKDSAAIRTQSQTLRAQSARNRVCPTDPDALWNGENGGIPDPKRPEEPPGGSVRVKLG
jgi:hypothetical protein